MFKDSIKAHIRAMASLAGRHRVLMALAKRLVGLSPKLKARLLRVITAPAAPQSMAPELTVTLAPEALRVWMDLQAAIARRRAEKS